jgi:hypothetical protein
LWFLVSGFWFLVSGFWFTVSLSNQKPQTRNQKLETKSVLLPLHHSYGIARNLGEIRIAIVRGALKRLKRRTIADRPECGGRLTLDLTILVGCQEPD